MFSIVFSVFTLRHQLQYGQSEQQSLLGAVSSLWHRLTTGDEEEKLKACGLLSASYVAQHRSPHGLVQVKTVHTNVSSVFALHSGCVLL